ncbi:Gametocyte-specific factor 1 [Orchesella cincta]|uniref:Gametocyte-specific factor 1 n=1 Tax=Orchesella cincta TaxID=48709 RepID=A0A1D2MM41_ORCCI|nr:Gametocyte-specific factor 1 [Orchesella cincta]
MAYPGPTGTNTSMDTVPEGSGTQPQPVNMNTMLVCSSNESHLCSGGRYFAHIDECKKVSGGAPAVMLQCPFRSSHHVDATAMRQHIEMCDGYYEWHMLNQKDPPSMVAEYQMPNDMVKKEGNPFGAETGSDGVGVGGEAVVGSVARILEDFTDTKETTGTGSNPSA